MRVFDNQWAVLLTTFRRNGVGVATAVNLAVEGDHGYFRTYARAGKLKRIRRNPDGQVAPCSPTGKPSGPAVPCRIRVLDRTEAAHAEQAIKRKHPIVQVYSCPSPTRLCATGASTWNSGCSHRDGRITLRNERDTRNGCSHGIERAKRF